MIISANEGFWSNFFSLKLLKCVTKQKNLVRLENMKCIGYSLSFKFRI